MKTNKKISMCQTYYNFSQNNATFYGYTKRLTLKQEFINFISFLALVLFCFSFFSVIYFLSEVLVSLIR